jgi:hypothetical protein
MAISPPARIGQSKSKPLDPPILRPIPPTSSLHNPATCSRKLPLQPSHLSSTGFLRSRLRPSPVVTFASSEGDCRTNKASHPLSHRSSHLGVTRSSWEHEGCAWRDYQFGRGQNTVLGWSDPTFWHCPVAKVTAGSLQPNEIRRLLVCPSRFAHRTCRQGGV